MGNKIKANAPKDEKSHQRQIRQETKQNQAKIENSQKLIDQTFNAKPDKMKLLTSEAKGWKGGGVSVLRGLSFISEAQKIAKAFTVEQRYELKIEIEHSVRDRLLPGEGVHVDIGRMGSRGIPESISIHHKSESYFRAADPVGPGNEVKNSSGQSSYLDDAPTSFEVERGGLESIYRCTGENPTGSRDIIRRQEEYDRISNEVVSELASRRDRNQTPICTKPFLDENIR